MAPRILSIAKDFGLGGTQRTAVQYAQLYRAAGIDSHVAAISPHGPRLAACIEQMLVVSDNAVSADEALSRLRPHVVHIHREGWTDPIWSALIDKAAARGAEIIETNVFSRPDFGAAAAKISLHLHLTEWGHRKWLNWTRRLDTARSAVVPYVVFDDTFVPTTRADSDCKRVELGISPSSTVVGRIGQPIEAKWSRHTVDAFMELVRRHPGVDLRLVLVGAPPSVRSRVGQLRGIAKTRITLLDTTPSDAELCKLYGMFDMFLHTARIGESFGLVLAEAMMCDVPVITLATPLRDNGQVCVVNDGVGGRVAWSHRELVACLEAECFQRDRPRLAPRKWAQSSFGVERVRNSLLSALESVGQGVGYNGPGGVFDHPVDEPPPPPDFASMLPVGQPRARRAATLCALEVIHRPVVYRARRNLQ